MRRAVSAVLAATVAMSCLAPAASAKHFESPEEQRAQERKFDRKGILRSPEMRTDTSEKFITIPADYDGPTDFDVAAAAPAIDFAIVQGLDPWYVPSFEYQTGGIYGGWGAVVRGPDECFYFSIGNHMGHGGTAYMIKYDPVRREQSIVVDLQKTVGYGDDVFGDGKFHGDPDIGPGGDMWLLSFFGPGPTKEDLATTYRGSWLIRHNIFSGETENLGIPLEGESWPYHSYDWERHLLFAVGALNNNVLAYDTKERRVLYGANPPHGIHWNQRGILLDRDTGNIYTTDSGAKEGNSHRFVRYERRNNTFTIMESAPPPHPVTGEVHSLRAHTERRSADGSYWCFDKKGGVFKFWPDEDRVESVGVNWDSDGEYIANIAMSPGGRYLYYLLNAATSGAKFGTPLVQYDTRTGRKKVIAFLHPFYVEQYGYGAGGTYGYELDKDGASIFLYTNGRFTEKGGSSSYGRPAIFHIHIPESERVE